MEHKSTNRDEKAPKNTKKGASEPKKAEKSAKNSVFPEKDAKNGQKVKKKPRSSSKKTARSERRKRILHTTESIAGLLVLFGVVTSILFYLASGHNSRSVLVPELTERPYFYWGGISGETDPAELHRTVVSYLSVPDLVSPDILDQLNNSKASVMFYNLKEERFYCAIPRDEFYGPEDFDLLTDKPGNVRRGRRKDGAIYLGEYKMNTTNAVFFSFPAEDLIVFPAARMSFPYKSAVYSLSLKELVTYFYNRSIYGGFYVNQCRSDPDSVTNGPINCGAFVAYPGEPSIKVLSQQLADRDSSKENRVQKFLNFVTKEIKNEPHLVKPPQTIKKPSETLMTGSGGYHDKAILLASILEQTDIDYLIAYTDEAVALLVEGDFQQQRNALDLFINDKQYHLAPLTARGFQIGQPAPEGFTADTIRYIQRPGINTTLIELPAPE